MVLRTVRVPPGMEDVFAAAEAVVSRYFQDDHRVPERGTIEISGERYVLVRAASLSVEFVSLVETLFGAGRQAEAHDFARNILFDLAHTIGKSDARTFHAKMGLRDPLARISAGPIHFAHTGWAFVELVSEGVPTGDPAAYVTVFDHPYSFEADAWIRADRRPAYPVCIMNAGYASGWSEESYGMPVVASEILCRARGDERCRFVMGHPQHLEVHVRHYLSGEPKVRAEVRGWEIPDFFKRKRVEDELRSQLGQAHKLEAVGRLTGGIAHDFNNILSIVLARCYRAQQLVGPEHPAHEELEQIALAGRRAADMTHKLLAFGRAQMPQRTVLDLAKLVTETAQLLRPLVAENVELVLAIDPETGNVQADHSQLEQVITNLVVNAVDAMPDGGKLTLATRRAADGWVELEVTDTGIGMTATTLANAFDPFFTTKRERGGSGLGLSTVYGIVQQTGGTITADSQPGQGSTFLVRFPATGAETAPEAPEHAPPVDAHRGTESILLAEDESALREVLVAVLRDHGYEVLAAETPERALALAQASARRIDLLVTDVIMPKMSGPELAERVVGLYPSARVLFISGYTGGADVTASGASLLPKPFTPDALTKRVRQVLDARD